MYSNKMLVIAAISIISLNVIAQENYKKEIKPSTKNPIKTTYTCPMHKNVVSNKPVKCKACGMNLKEVKLKGHQH